MKRFLAIIAALLCGFPAFAQTVTTTIPSVSLHPGYVSGQWYSPLATSGNGLALTADTVRCAPTLVLKSGVKIVELDINVTILSSPGNMQLALYTNGADSRPDVPIVSTGNIDVSTTGVKQTVVAATELPAGPIWFCANSDNATVATVSVAGTSGATTFLLGAPNTTAALSTTALNIGISATKTFGTWDDFTGLSWASINTARMPWVAFEVQ